MRYRRTYGAKPVWDHPGLYMTYPEYIRSEFWYARRDAYVDKVVDGVCENGRDNLAEVVHHLWYPAVWGTETDDSLAYVCRPCHDIIHGRVARTG